MSTPDVRLGDVLEVLIDHRGRTPRKLGGDFVADGVPVISAKNIKAGRVDWSQRIRYVTPDMYRRWMPVPLARGDVLVTSEAPLGEVAQVPDERALVLGQRLFALRGQPDRVNNAFLANLLRWAPIQDRIHARASGSTVIGIRQSELVQIRIPLPPLTDQQRIANVLGGMDERASINRILNDAAVSLAASLLQLASQRSDSHVLLGAVADIRKGLSYKGAGLADSGMPMVNLANAAAFGGFKRSGWKYYTGDYKSRHVTHGGDLLVANTEQTWRNEILGWPMLVPDDVDQALFSHHVSIIDFKPEWRHLRLATWAYLFTTEARQRVEAFAHGTTVAALPAEALTGLQVPVLDRNDSALEQAEALLARAWAAERESEALAQLRGALLPALMSGQLQVRDAEELVGEAV